MPKLLQRYTPCVPKEPLSLLECTNWKEASDILTDSLWILGNRNNEGAHRPDYHGNFVPQIPNQAMRRFTRRGEVVLDPFCGMGTTLIEARRLGRHAIGIELNPEVAESARERIAEEPNPYGVNTLLLTADSTQPETAQQVQAILHAWGFSHTQLLLLHPPYHDIIRFSEDPRDLSNAPTETDFLERFEQVLRLFIPTVEVGRLVVLVIGDKYSKGEWVPLGFRTMEQVLKQGLRLKSICVKDIQENRGKRGQHNLWRYRALKYSFYLFKHEYVMFFQVV